MAVADVPLYLERAHEDLKAPESNLEHGFYAVAVARAYYAMFYAASGVLASLGISRSKHSGVLSAFGDHVVKSGLMESEYAKMLSHAFDSRLDTDYDVAFTAHRGLAEDQLRDARRFVERAEEYLREAGAL
jgi:uncharacterized protein (UPF0332 family)